MILIITELENLEQGIEKLRRAPDKDLEKMVSETLPGMTPSPAVRAYLEEMEVRNQGQHVTRGNMLLGATRY